MKQKTAEALHEMIKIAAKSVGYEGEIIATVCNAKIPETCNHKGRKLINFNEESYESTYHCKKCGKTFVRKPKFVCG